MVCAGGDFFGVGEVHPCTLTLIILCVFDFCMHLYSSSVACMYPWVCVGPMVVLCVCDWHLGMFM